MANYLIFFNELSIGIIILSRFFKLWYFKSSSCIVPWRWTDGDKQLWSIHRMGKALYHHNYYSSQMNIRCRAGLWVIQYVGTASNQEGWSIKNATCYPWTQFDATFPTKETLKLLFVLVRTNHSENKRWSTSLGEFFWLFVLSPREWIPLLPFPFCPSTIFFFLSTHPRITM